MSDEYEKEFCVLLRSFREKRLEQRRWGMKWDQGAVAKRIGVSRVTYNQWENGLAVASRYHLKKRLGWQAYLDGRGILGEEERRI
jgi:DNA-binding XRE family transcriptional regulator